MTKTVIIDTDSPKGSFAKAIARQSERERLNADIVAKNMTIKAMAKKGATLAEIMTETGKTKNYIKRIGGSLLK